jgi:hypothetical protein
MSFSMAGGLGQADWSALGGRVAPSYIWTATAEIQSTDVAKADKAAA